MSDGAKRRALGAWDPRVNLRRVFVPGKGALPAIDGIRALALLWVVSMHSLFYLQPFLDEGPMKRLSTDRRLHLIWKGDFGIELFLVISGFLIGRLLMVEHVERGTIDVPRFYARRALRILPAYYVALGVASWFGQDNLENTWANLLYVNNFLPYEDQNMVWAWSLAIEEQFYLVVPTLVWLLFRLQARTRVILLLVAYVGSFFVCAAVVADAGLVLADIQMVPDQDEARWILHFDTLYDKPHTRYGPLVFGLLLAHLQAVAPERLRAFAAWRPALHVAGLVLAFSAMAFGLGLFRDPGPRWAEIAFLAGFRQVFAFGVFTLVLLSLVGGPVGRPVAAVLGLRALYPVAQLTYSSYLLNPILTLCFYAYVWNPDPSPGYGQLALYALGNLLFTLACALPLHLLIERPLMNLRPGGRR